MEYRKYQNDYVIRLDPKDEIVSCLKQICETENIVCASIQGLGAVDDFEIGAYDLSEKKFYGNHFTFPAEITSLVGNVTRMNEETYLHLHMTVADKEGNAYGGHLNRALISCTGELFLHVVEGEVNRNKDEVTGLNVLSF